MIVEMSYLVLVLIVDDGGAHAAHRTLARLDEIRLGGGESEGVGDSGRREVVHLVVPHNSQRRRGSHRAQAATKWSSKIMKQLAILDSFGSIIRSNK